MGTNIPTEFPAPFGNYYKTVKEQYLFKASEISLQYDISGLSNDDWLSKPQSLIGSFEGRIISSSISNFTLES